MTLFGHISVNSQYREIETFINNSIIYSFGKRK